MPTALLADGLWQAWHPSKASLWHSPDTSFSQYTFLVAAAAGFDKHGTVQDQPLIIPKIKYYKIIEIVFGCCNCRLGDKDLPNAGAPRSLRTPSLSSKSHGGPQDNGTAKCDLLDKPLGRRSAGPRSTAVVLEEKRAHEHIGVHPYRVVLGEVGRRLAQLN